MFIGGDEVAGLAAQVLDLVIEEGDELLQASQEEIRHAGGKLSGVALVLGLGSELVQSRNAARAGADGQDQGIRALPGLERHALGKLGQDRGIDGIGLGAGLDRLGEAFGGLGVDHHQVQPGIIQGQVEVIQACDLQTDAADLDLAQAVGQGGMSLGGVLELAGFPHPAIAADDQGDGFMADIDSGGCHVLVLQIA